MRLKNKTAFITGAAQGIGEAIAASFVKEGAFVIITDIHRELDEKTAKKYGDKILYIPLDVSKESDWKNAISIIQKKGLKLDAVVNNAGITGFNGNKAPMNPEECTIEDWQRVHKVNLDGVFFGCKYGIKLMKDRGGSIINMSSRSGIVGIPEAAPYASSKAAVRNHTKSVALYCAEKRYEIRCNSIHPAAILTPMWETMLGTGETRKKALKNIEATVPLHRLGDPMDVAYAAIYLAADESNFMTGSEIHIDGGILAGASASPKKAEVT
ncbi:MAG: 3-beta-hydroxysteroid dehydrogenase [Candidatus Anoxychlamydiales bacterium]|nr:3-beta-hydroxysteroid dehydrogenase [Candidatus Anoxychlamydiales bacterium]